MSCQHLVSPGHGLLQAGRSIGRRGFPGLTGYIAMPVNVVENLPAPVLFLDGQAVQLLIDFLETGLTQQRAALLIQAVTLLVHLVRNGLPALLRLCPCPEGQGQPQQCN